MDLSFFQSFSLFKGIKEKELKNLLSQIVSREQDFLKGETIFDQGESIHEMGLIESGELIGCNYDLMGHSNVIARLSRGELFGESYAYLNDVPLFVSVSAIKDSHIIFLDANRIKEVSNDLLNKNLISIIAQKNMALTRKLNCITPKSIRERLNAYLETERNIHHSNTFDIAFNRQELADYLLVDRSSLSHELSLMAKEGLITFKKNHFHINQL